MGFIIGKPLLDLLARRYAAAMTPTVPVATPRSNWWIFANPKDKKSARSNLTRPAYISAILFSPRQQARRSLQRRQRA